MQKYPVDRFSDKILVISYPAGGFGHFIFYLLTHFTKETVKVPDELKFSGTGDSHHQLRYIFPWFSNRDPNYVFDCSSVRYVQPDEIAIVIHDAGHDGIDPVVQNYFPNARFVKVCAEPEVRIPLLELSIFKALQSNWEAWLDHQKATSKTKFDIGPRTPWISCQLTWKYATNLLAKFCPSGYHNFVNVSLKNFILDTETTFRKLAHDLNLTVINEDELRTKLQSWTDIHQQFFDAVRIWDTIERALDQQTYMDLSHITDWKMKCMIFYNVCNKYYIKVPVLEWLSDTTPEHIKTVALDGFTSTDHILNFVETYDSV